MNFGMNFNIRTFFRIALDDNEIVSHGLFLRMRRRISNERWNIISVAERGKKRKEKKRKRTAASRVSPLEREALLE